MNYTIIWNKFHFDNIFLATFIFATSRFEHTLNVNVAVAPRVGLRVYKNN